MKNTTNNNRYCERCDEAAEPGDKGGHECQNDGTEIRYELVCAYCVQEILEDYAHSTY